MRRGYSLVEVLVAVGIMALLMGLILSAVQRVRAVSARTACSNNLRQIALANQSYHQQANAFPAGVVGPDDKMPFSTWLVRLLPHLDQAELWDRTVAAYQHDRSFLHDPPHTGLSRPLAVFACAADSRASTAPVLEDSIGRGLTSYLGVAGRDAGRGDGILFLNSRVKSADVRDGLSSTILIGERPPSPDFHYGWWYGGWGQDLDGDCDSVLGARAVNRQNKYPSCPLGPYPFAPGKLDNSCDSFHFWSLHLGGANFAFADGSVRFLRYSTDDILPALATRAGAETVIVPE
ncbi:DUF1559 domain-containing protein [Gemmata massiliana]|uniref:DUF1559 domain-containing protein n=1 Tax=Gemmata massiliana TaxID=1210884 RepID=UPI0021BCF0BF|nr:DUF1559 domain-containing protein [Gemmata massiliana]